MASDQCGCVKLVVGSWSLSRFFIFSEFFSGLCLCSSSGSYSYSSSCSVLVPLLVLLPGSRLLMMRSPVLFLVALVLVLAADQKFCPKERHGDKCKAKQLRRQVFIPSPSQTSLQVCLQVRCLLQRPLSQRSPGLARGSS